MKSTEVLNHCHDLMNGAHTHTHTCALYLSTCVSSKVSDEVAFICEWFVTDVTFVQFFPSVSANMDCQGTLCAESPFTHLCGFCPVCIVKCAFR